MAGVALVVVVPAGLNPVEEFALAEVGYEGRVVVLALVLVVGVDVILDLEAWKAGRTTVLYIISAPCSSE